MIKFTSGVKIKIIFERFFDRVSELQYVLLPRSKVKIVIGLPKINVNDYGRTNPFGEPYAVKKG